jgi:hypothetical protein
VNGDPRQGFPCKIWLDGGGVDTYAHGGLNCGAGFANYDSQTNRTSILNIGGEFGSGGLDGVEGLSIDLQFEGTPPTPFSSAWTPPWVASPAGPGPNNITIILAGGSPTYFTSYAGSGPGQMSMTLTDVEPATGTQTGSSSLYCIHGFVTADVPKLSPGAPSVIHLDAGF